MADEKLKVAGIKLKIDGAATFSDNLNKINSRLKTNSSELKKVQAQYKGSEKSIEGLTAKQKALQSSLDAQKKKTSELKDVLNEAAEEYGENSKEVERLKSAVAQSEAAEAGFEAQLRETNDLIADQSNKLKNLGKKLDEGGSKIEKFGDKTAKVGGKLTTGLTLPIAALGTGAVAAFKEIDDGYDIIIKKTGATGEALNDLNRVAENVYTSMPVNMDDVGNAVGELNTRFDINGDVLEDATRKSLEFARVNDADVTSSIRNVSRYMGDAGIDASQYGSVLDTLTVAGQKTGISMDKLTEYLAKYGAPMRALGFETRESIALFSQWEKSGVNVEIAFSGMKKAISTWAKDGKDSREEFKKTLDEIKACPDIAAATTKAIEVFGTKAGPDLADAIKGGRFEYTELLNVIENSAGALDSTYESLLDGADDTVVAINKGKNALSKLGETVLNSAAPAIEKFSEFLEKATAWYNKLNDGEKKAVITTLAVVAAMGPVVSVGGKIIKTGGKVVKTVGKMAEFFTKGGKAATVMADGTKAASAATGALSVSTGGLVLTLAAAAVPAYLFYSAVKEVTDNIEDLDEKLKTVGDTLVSDREKVEAATSALSGLNAESAMSQETAYKIDEGIDKAQEKIIKIAEHAAEKSRGITQKEYEEISKLIGMIDSYTDKKLEAYNTQQSSIKAMASRDYDMTDEKALEYRGSALETYNTALEIAEKTRINLYNTAQKTYEAAQTAYKNKEISQEELTIAETEYKKTLDTADSNYSEACESIQKQYADTLAIILERYTKANMAGSDAAKAINSLIDSEDAYWGKLDEYEGTIWEGLLSSKAAQQNIADSASEAFTGKNGEIVSALINMASDVELYGGELEEYSRIYSNKVIDAFEGLPDETKDTMKNTMEGAISGLQSKEPTLYAKATSIANGVIARLKKAFDIHSPSRVTRRMFQYVDEGAIYGLKDKEQELYSQGEKLGVGTAAAISRGYSSKAVNIGTLADLYPTVSRAGAAYSNSRTYNSTYSNDTYDSGIHIGTLNVNGASGTGTLISELETIEYARREQARSRGER